VPELDFSNYAEEKEELGITLIDGERIVLPKILDTYTVMEVVGNLNQAQAAKLPQGEKNRLGLALLKAILGPENTKKFINGVPNDKQEEAGREILRYYGLAASEAEGEEGKAQEEVEAEPEEADQSPSPTKRSTTTSDTSTPTSSDSSPPAGESSIEDASTSEFSLAGLAPSPLSRSS
jgi:hypothetical protein